MGNQGRSRGFHRKLDWPNRRERQTARIDEQGHRRGEQSEEEILQALALHSYQTPDEPKPDE